MSDLTLSKSVLLTDLAYCINQYRMSTPGIYVCVLMPIVLRDQRFVAGVVGQVNHGRLKQCEATEEAFLGPPNFVLDVFGADEMEEFEVRKQAFESAGVIEYVAVFADSDVRCQWFRNSGAKFDEVQPAEDGVIKSKALPGLWFSTASLGNRDWWSLGDTISRGITRLGHHEFMETIWHKEGRDPEWGDWLPFESG